MFGKTNVRVIERPQAVALKDIGYKQDIESAVGSFRLVRADLLALGAGSDLVLKEGVEQVGKNGDYNAHVRTDYILHPRSAIRITDDQRYSVKVSKVSGLDSLIRLHLNPEFAERFFGGVPQRDLTEDGWELWHLNGQELLEMNGEAYKPCNTCHERSPEFIPAKRDDPKDLVFKAYWGRFTPVQEKRTFKLRIPLQELMRATGLVITRVEHPCYTSLSDMLNGSQAVDPPKLEPVFPSDLSL